ncbi:MAG: DNA-3-methyladenine glycosylase I [Phycisphaerales bacterium]|nr:DNA-3-methyladenine glycosylase I [Phycisphaerales bacterium]
MHRCAWAKSENMIAYHDTEWGVPVHDDALLFEHLFLDTMQAGLSWACILNKRENFRKAFSGFDPRKIVRYDSRKLLRLLADPGIIRNKLKVHAAVTNARAFLAIQKEFSSFDQYLWAYVPDRKPIINHWQQHQQLPASTALSDVLSKDLYKRGFKFVGSTICYAMMQAVGMVNDHTTDCFRHAQVNKYA